MFNQTCRTCLNNTGEMISIFSYDSYVSHLAKKLMSFTKIQITENDDLPKVMCKKCIFLTDSFYCFKEQCETAEITLKSWMNGSNNDHFLKENKKKRNLEDTSSVINPAKRSNWRKTQMNDSIRNVEQFQEIEEDEYVVEYISDAVKTEVESVMKRRQEAETKIYMEKVSETIKNLKGIEVVPINNFTVTCAEKKINAENERIVMFPVNVPKKKYERIETIVTNNSLESGKKKLSLPADTTLAKINEDHTKRKDTMHKKPNFSMVRKVVNINTKKLGIELKGENLTDLGKRNSYNKDNIDIIVIEDSDEADNSQFQCSVTQMNENKLNINERKKDLNSSQNNLQDTPKVEAENSESLIYNYVIDTNDNNKFLNISIKNDSSENENEIFIPSSKDLQQCIKSDDLKTDDSILKSTIDNMINEIDVSNVDINKTNDEANLLSCSNVNDDSEIITSYRMDNIVETLTGNEDRNECIIDKSASPSVTSNINQKQKTGSDSGFSDDVKPLAFLSVNSSGKENRKSNLKIYQRNGSEKLNGVAGKNSLLKDQTAPSFSHRRSKSKNSTFYQCIRCLTDFVSMPAVLKHNIQEHMPGEGPFDCRICDKSFQDKSSLSDHVEEHNDTQSFKCTFCPKTFNVQKNLKRHINHHINGKPFQCQICLKKFSEKSSFKSHIHLHTGDSPFTCKSCNVSFNNKSNWRRHIITTHEKLTAVVCEFCKKELPDRRSLNVHLRVHTGDRPYQCPHCAKKFTQQCNLNTHIHCHLNDRPFSCPYCEKSFNQKATRDDHILTHTGERPYKCTECEASFRVSSALKRHMWIHTDKNRPYNCEKCKLQFVGFYDLKKHMKLRHEEVIQPEIPRIEKVTTNEQNKGRGGVDIFREIELTSSEAGAVGIIPPCTIVECNEVKLPVGEDDATSCQVAKFENVEKEAKEENLYNTEVENSHNSAKEEPVNDSETLLKDYVQTPTSGIDIREQ